MLIKKDYQNIYILLCDAGIYYGVYYDNNNNELIRFFPEDYDVLNCPFREVPFHINHAEESVRIISSYRLRVKR